MIGAQSERRLMQPQSVLEFTGKVDSATAGDLKTLFDRYGSDKATFHDYHFVYDKIIGQVGKVVTMLEIGLGTNNRGVLSNMGRMGRPGASLRAFRDYLPDALVYGADIDRRVLFQDDRIRTFFVDQTEPASIDRLFSEIDTELELIIDDGLHAPAANIAVLIAALPKLRPGGWFVIEDIAEAALPVWQVVDMLMPNTVNTAFVTATRGSLYVGQKQR